MKLREFNTENTFSTRTRKPTVSINARSGLFIINRPACALIGLDDSKQLVFHQDEEEPESWFIEVVKENGFSMRLKDKSKALFLNNKEITRSIFASVQLPDKKSGRMPISPEAQLVDKRKLFALITASLKVRSED